MKQKWIETDLSVRNNFYNNYTPSFLAKSSFFYIQSIGHFYCNPDYYTRREGYKSYLLLYTLNGKGYAVYREKQYELTRGKILLIDCNDYQEYFTDRDDLWEIKWFHFNGGSSHNYFNLIYDNYGPVIDMNQDQSVLDKIHSIMDLIKHSDVQLEVKASGIIVQILTDIILTASKGSDNLKKNEHNIHVNAALDFIENNFHLDISLKDIAETACSSVFHFTRIFKKITGYSPYEYLIKYRINTAKTLLETTDMSIENIAGNIGFKSTSNLILIFKKFEDITPLKYRKYWNG